MGTTPNIRVKGMSRIAYNFLWDQEIRHYAYSPKNQKEVDDIFRTQGMIYHHMYFSVWLEPLLLLHSLHNLKFWCLCAYQDLYQPFSRPPFCVRMPYLPLTKLLYSGCLF